jgi:hypothetical protein
MATWTAEQIQARIKDAMDRVEFTKGNYGVSDSRHKRAVEELHKAQDAERRFYRPRRKVR